jgi:tetratricopeptide (TPR) repeat protein
LAACSRQQEQTTGTAAQRLKEAEAALANDSVRQGETLLRECIRLSEKSGDWHTNYIAYQRLAEAVSQSNPQEALRLMKKGLTVYEQHPDDERNHVILLDYAGTFAAQVAYINEGSYDEALHFVHRAYDMAKNGGMTDMMCQTLESLINRKEKEMIEQNNEVAKKKPVNSLLIFLEQRLLKTSCCTVITTV